MVPFAGYSMPVQYSDLSVGDSHRWTRTHASLFDVGHMVQHMLSGPGAQALLERMTPAGLTQLEPSHSTLSCLLNEAGGIVDDCVITRIGPERFYLVTNAACREKDLGYIQAEKEKMAGMGEVEWEVMDGQGLVALQGPRSAEVLGEALARVEEVDLKKLYFGQCKEASVKLADGRRSEKVLISRAGYTGEDGFEVSIPEAETVEVVRALLRIGGEDRLRWAGLGARDSLRLEAGMCLYGHDLDDTTSPVEAGLSWVVGKGRKTGGGFHGADVVLRQLKPKKEGGGVERRRVGFTIEGAPAREGAEVVSEEGQVIGKITSGCPSPTLSKNIAMGYIKSGFNKSGTKVGVVVRGKKRAAQVTKMPFVASRYWKQEAGTAPA